MRVPSIVFVGALSPLVEHIVPGTVFVSPLRRIMWFLPRTGAQTCHVLSLGTRSKLPRSLSWLVILPNMPRTSSGWRVRPYPRPDR